MKNIRPQHCATLEPIKSRSGVYASGSLGAIQFLRFTTWLEVTAERLTRARHGHPTARPARARFPVVIMLLIDRFLDSYREWRRDGLRQSAGRLDGDCKTFGSAALSVVTACRTSSRLVMVGQDRPV